MNLFMTNKQAAEKISGLEARVAELEADQVNAAARITELEAEVVTNTETIATLTADLATAQATIADQESTINAANEKLSTFDSEVATKAQLQIASLGFKGEIPESKNEEKQELSNLTGLAKATAAHKASKKK